MRSLPSPESQADSFHHETGQPDRASSTGTPRSGGACVPFTQPSSPGCPRGLSQVSLCRFVVARLGPASIPFLTLLQPTPAIPPCPGFCRLRCGDRSPAAAPSVVRVGHGASQRGCVVLRKGLHPTELGAREGSRGTERQVPLTRLPLPSAFLFLLSSEKFLQTVHSCHSHSLVLQVWFWPELAFPPSCRGPSVAPCERTLFPASLFV